MNRKIITVLIFIFSLSLPLFAQLSTNGGTPYLLSQAKDMSADFADFTNLFFFADKLSAFDTEKLREPLSGNVIHYILGKLLM
jgi:alpha-D-xyloside xylohydrolase